MTEDAASSSSSALSPASPAWSPGPRRSLMRTTEKSVVFRVRTEEKVSSGRGRSERHSSLRLQGGATCGSDDSFVHETLAELYDEVQHKKEWLSRVENEGRRTQEHIDGLQRQHAALLQRLEKSKRRRKEKLRIQKMLRGPRAQREVYGSDSDSDSGYSSHRSRSSRHHSHRDPAKKERKKLRRFQSEMSLRFQLLQSECRRSDLKVETLVTNLRREYNDSCLFGNSLGF
jgi:hypothetical protein